MAIGFVKPRYVSRSTGGNACRSGAYNARSKIVDERTGEIFDFTVRGGNVYHEILLPEHVDKKFKNASVLSNEVELSEHRIDSQLYVEWLLALPKEKAVTLEMKKEIISRFIEYKGWIKEGLSVQIDIHKPHEDEVNWHAHLLTSTRRFTKDGLGFLALKARDLQPKVVNGRVVEETKDSIAWTNLQNDYFKEIGLNLRVDLPGEITQEHVGPVRMRNIFNQAAERNEVKRIANIENLTTGKRLLDYVTNHMSVFNEGDLKRAVKFIPEIRNRERLVEDALANKSLLQLYDDNGVKTGYYTTKEVREEETKLLRLGGYVASGKNVISMMGLKGKNHAKELTQNARNIFSEEQHQALSHLLLEESGVRILRGRAGTGKSHVLGQVASIAKACGINVIGVAPTHKAKEELAKKPGFDQNDTIKGMLFKLRNGRFELPKYSLLVVDEAGMIGNEDYHELLRVAATRKCNVILAGDERQLASVQRGGMFEVFAGSYGSSTLLDIQRQNTDWGKSVAMAFSKGEVGTGVGVLQAQNRLIQNKDANESMQSLLAAWNKSEEPITNRLIIAVKNKDVDSLNHGARQYLKLEGELSGAEIAVGGRHYMKGDRILIKQTNKDLGLTNGDLARVVHASKDRFVLRLEEGGDNAREIAFDPSTYSGFKHGYATTVFKAQGASIKDVFVFHDGFAGVRNSYVALSRHVANLNLYINEQSTKSIPHLIKQLGHDPEIGSSLSYLTKEEFKVKEIDDRFAKSKGIFGGLVVGALEFASRKITELKDKHLPASEYYQYKAPEIKRERVEEVLDTIGLVHDEGAFHVQEKIAVGGHLISAGNIDIKATSSNNIVSRASASLTNSTKPSSNGSKVSAKGRFYAKADHVKNAAKQLEQKAIWDNESEKLRHLVKFKTEQIARELLGEPNNRLSNGKTLRFGEHGKLAVRISGERMGNWYDFSSSTGGDIFALVQEKQNCDFKGAAEYLRRSVGIQNSNLSLVHDHRNSDLTENYIKARKAEESEAKAKQALVDKLYEKSKVIGDKSVAHRYLTKERGITSDVGLDIKTTGISTSVGHSSSSNPANNEKVRIERREYLPAIVAFARDSRGIVTGGQQILLDKHTGGKADVDIVKKSFGKIAGSFVEVGKSANAPVNHNITIIAEGLETALSIKQALSKDEDNKNISIKILCSLGISNIKNYQPSQNEKIIIAADNDGEHSITTKTIETAKSELQNKGAFVEIVCPDKIGDFNDILRQDDKGAGIATGEKEIQSTFKKALLSHTSTTLGQYFAAQGGHKLSNQEKDDIAYIQKFNVNEEKIIGAYRASPLKGALELESTRKEIGFIESFLKENKHIINEAKQYGADIDNHKVALSLMGKKPAEMERKIITIKDHYCINDHLEEFKQSQSKGNTPKEVIQNMYLEQKFLSGYYDNLKYPEDHSPELINSIKVAHKNEQENSIGQLTKLVTFLEKNTKSESILEILKGSSNPTEAHKSLLSEYHAKSVEKIHAGLSLLDKGKTFTLDNKNFDCPVKFLDHLVKTRTHEYFPKVELQKIQSKVIESHHKQPELSKGLEGPDF
jgi:Ti-type conjugative transfer relaxase TraA